MPKEGRLTVSVNTLVVDAMNLVYKVFYKVPALKTAKGKSTGIIYGFIRQLQSLHTKFNPGKIIITWDNKDSVRKTIDPEYKANRKDKSDIDFKTLIAQVGELKKDLREIGLVNYESTGLESDDIIAVLARAPQYEHLKPMLIVSTDTDLYQLLQPDVYIYSGKEIWDNKVFQNRFGFKPTLYPIYKALAGCTTDNVKGVYGYGDAKIKKLFDVCHFSAQEVLNEIESRGLKAPFFKALRLVVLPYNLNYNVNLPQENNRKLNLKATIDFFYKNDIFSMDPKEFLQ